MGARPFCSGSALSADGRVGIFSSERRKSPVKKSPLPILFVFVVVDLLGFSLILPLLPYYAKTFAASPLVIGLLGGNISLAQAYITDVTDEKSRARSLGIIGPALGGLLSGFGCGVPALAAAGLSLVNFVWIAAALPESLSAKRRAALALNPRPAITARALIEALRRPRVGPLLHTQLFYALAFGVFTASFSLYALERLGLAAQATGYILAYVGVISVLVQALAIGPLTSRFSEQKLIVALAPMAVGAGVLGTVLNSALTKSVSRDEVGGTLGLASSLQSLTQVVAPVLGGFLLGQLGSWSLGVLGALIMGWLATFTWRKLLRVSPPGPAPGG